MNNSHSKGALVFPKDLALNPAGDLFPCIPFLNSQTLVPRVGAERKTLTGTGCPENQSGILQSITFCPALVNMGLFWGLGAGVTGTQNSKCSFRAEQEEAGGDGLWMSTSSGQQHVSAVTGLEMRSRRRVVNSLMFLSSVRLQRSSEELMEAASVGTCVTSSLLRRGGRYQE